MKKKSLMLGFSGAFIAIAAYAQTPGFTRTALQTQDLSVPNKVVVQAKAEFDQALLRGGTHTLVKKWGIS